MLGAMNFMGKPRTQVTEALTSWHVTKMLGQAKLMVQSEVTYRLSALWFPGYEAVKELKESQILVSESQRSWKTTGQK